MEDLITVGDGKYKLEVYRDEFAESPRAWDNLGKMVCWHRRYMLGDKHGYGNPREFQESKEYKNAFVMLPLYLYDHSGITISTCDFGDRFDSGQVGYIYVTKEQAKKEYHCELDERLETTIRERLIGEVKMYDQYLQGDCYAFKIIDEQGEEIDSCGGFYGDELAEVLKEMRDSCNDEFGNLFNKMEKHSSAYTAMM